MTVTGEFVDTAERTLVAALVSTVGGATSVTLGVTMPVRIGWDD